MYTCLVAVFTVLGRIFSLSPTAVSSWSLGTRVLICHDQHKTSTKLFSNRTQVDELEASLPAEETSSRVPDPLSPRGGVSPAQAGTLWLPSAPRLIQKHLPFPVYSSVLVN